MRSNKNARVAASKHGRKSNQRTVNDKLSQPPRVAVLIVSYPDGYLEAFGDDHTDVHITRVPVAYSIEAEATAEDVTELLLPLRYRPLYRRGRLRKNGTTRPLLPSILNRSIDVQKCLVLLDMMTASEHEAMAWTL